MLKLTYPCHQRKWKQARLHYDDSVLQRRSREIANSRGLCRKVLTPSYSYISRSDADTGLYSLKVSFSIVGALSDEALLRANVLYCTNSCHPISRRPVILQSYHRPVGADRFVRLSRIAPPSTQRGTSKIH